MAYTLFPKTKGEIIKNCLKSPEKAADIVDLFGFLKNKFKDIDTPINIDVNILGKVNVSRELQGMIEIKDIIKGAKLTQIKIKFGAGSSGNRGVKNRGNLFENTFANSIRSHWDEEKKSNDQSISKAIIELSKIHKFNKLKNLVVKEEGAQNTKRPLKFQPGPYITSPTGTLNIGPAVTDLTLHEAKTIDKVTKSNVVAYLSLKLGGTTTFFNVGIKTILTKEDIETGTVTNKDGIKMLQMFGIDNQTFCKIFNGKLKQGVQTNTFGKINKSYLQTFLKSGIGYGFTVVHKINSSITKVFEIDEPYMMKAAKPQSCIVYYGGKTGTGKRVDIEIKTGKYMFKVNMRDTQGKDGYPTRIMGDFTYI
tara:strand:- start:49 stop:1143 length:1095 start_codon:yes stop_codon:yes gene_type:complete